MFSFVSLAPADPTAELESRQGRPNRTAAGHAGGTGGQLPAPPRGYSAWWQAGCVCTGAGGAGEPSHVLPGPRPAGRSPMPEAGLLLCLCCSTRHLPREIAQSLIFRDGGFLGQKKPLSRQAQAKQGIPLCFVQETHGGHLRSWGHREQGLWRVQLVNRTDTPRAARPSGPPPPFRSQNRGKLCFSFMTPGDRTGRLEPTEPGVLGWGCHTTKASCRTRWRY